MTARSWFRSPFTSSSPATSAPPQSRRRRRPLLEALEDRCLLTITPTGKSFSMTEGLSATPIVATFVDDNTSATLQATVHWGDGSSSPGTVSPVSGTTNTYQVTGTHTYAEEGMRATSIDITDTQNSTQASASGTATIADAPLHLQAKPVAAVEGQAVTSALVATFTDDDPAGTVSDYTATVDWGDGETSPGTITANDSGGFDVTASKPSAYAEEGTASLVVTVHDGGSSFQAADTWTSVANLPAARYSLAATTGPDGRIYALGGIDDTAHDVNTVYAYTPATNTWDTTVAPLPAALAGFAATTGPDGRIYALGGGQSTVYAYTPGAASWTTVASLPAARDALAATTGPDGRIYALGGLDGGVVQSTVYAYTPATNTWTTVASLPGPKWLHAATTGPDGRIYALGGKDTLGGFQTSTVYAYTPATNTWDTTVASLPAASKALGAATGPDGRIYAIGGSSGNTVYAYTPGAASWTTVASLPDARFGVAAATGPDGRIYALGGQGFGVQSTVYAYTAVAPSTATDSNSVTVADAALTAGTLSPPSAIEGQAFGPVTVFHFSDADPAGTASDYTAVITLGDANTLTVNSSGVVGTPPAGASGKIVAHTGGGFDVQLSYTYAEELSNQTFSVQVYDNGDGRTTSDPSDATTSASTSTFSVADAALTQNSFTAPVATAGAPFSGTVFNFSDADPNGTASDYTAVVTMDGGKQVTLTSTPSFYGKIVAHGDGTFDVNLAYTYATAGSPSFSVKVYDNGDGRTLTDPSDSTVTANGNATVTPLGLGVVHGLTGGIGFWNNSNGQALIKSFGKTATELSLANWLASAFPNIYGASTGANNLTNKSNAQVASYYQTLFAQTNKVQAQVLATALNVYATTQSLGGTAATKYGFTVNAYGLGAYSYNVGSDGAAFGVANNTTLNVYQLLMAVNTKANNGLLYNGDVTLQKQAADLLGSLNLAGSIS
jgi:N-acetylneuraminic acid mutarotase